MSADREGGCACGELRYRLASDPMFVHCCDCQRQTGSAFVVNLIIEADRVEVLSGTAHPVDAPREGAPAQRIFRCAQCETAVFSEYGRRELRFVRGGTLDDAAGIEPDVHIFTRSKAGWVSLPAGVPAFDAYYDEGELWPADSLRRVEALARS